MITLHWSFAVLLQYKLLVAVGLFVRLPMVNALFKAPIVT